MGLLSIDIGDDVIKTCSELQSGTQTKLVDGENSLLLEKRDKWVRISLEILECELVVQSTVSCAPFVNILLQSATSASPLQRGVPPQTSPTLNAVEVNTTATTQSIEDISRSGNTGSAETAPLQSIESSTVTTTRESVLPHSQNVHTERNLIADEVVEETEHVDLIPDQQPQAGANIQVPPLQKIEFVEFPKTTPTRKSTRPYKATYKITEMASTSELTRSTESTDSCEMKQRKRQTGKSRSKSNKKGENSLRLETSSPVDSLQQIADKFKVIIREIDIEGDSDAIESGQTTKDYMVSCTKCNKLVNQFNMTGHIRREHRAEAKSMVCLHNKIKRRLRELKRTQCQYCSRSIKFVNVLKHEELCKMRINITVKDEFNISQETEHALHVSDAYPSCTIDLSDDNLDETNELSDNDVETCDLKTSSDKAGTQSDVGEKENSELTSLDIPPRQADDNEPEMIQAIEREFNITVEKLDEEICPENEKGEIFSVSCLVCLKQVPQFSVNAHFKEDHFDRTDVDSLINKYTTIKRKLRGIRLVKCKYCSKYIRYVRLKKHQSLCESNSGGNNDDHGKKSRRQRLVRSGYESKEQIELDILRAAEKEFGVKIEKLYIELPGGDICTDDDNDQRFSVSCIACGDQIPQNSVNMHFKENHYERTDIPKVMHEYGRLKRILRELRQAKCGYCNRYMSYVNIERHQRVCKANSKQNRQELAKTYKRRAKMRFSQSKSFGNENDSDSTETETPKKKVALSDTLQEWLENISEQFEVSVKLIGANAENENLIWQEQLQNFTLSCRLCQEDILCCEINSHLKEKHTEQNQEKIDRFVTFYSKVKRRIRELRRTTCRFCGKNLRHVNLPAHLNTCKLNPANCLDVEDIAAEQFEIDAILENIYDTYQIRIVRANTLQPNTPRGRNSVVNEAFIVTCYICGAQFEHFDIEEHLSDFHAEDDHIHVTRDRYRRALIMLIGENEAECLFCNEKISIADLSSHMKDCRTRVMQQGNIDEMLSTATDLDLLVQSLSRRFQVEISRCPEYGEEEEESHEDKEPLFLVTCEICQEGVLHLAMRGHLRKVHGDCKQDTFYKYSKITRRLQDLRKLKCVYCNKYFRVVSLRVHMRRCVKDKASTTDLVIETLHSSKTHNESFCDKFHEVKKTINVDPMVICEQIFATHNVKVNYKNGVYYIQCDLCDESFDLEAVKGHVKKLHNDVIDQQLLLDKYKRVTRRIKESEKRQRAPTIECKYCHRKIKVIAKSSYSEHLRKCALYPSRGEETTATKMRSEMSGNDDKLDTDITEGGELALEYNMGFVCEICVADFRTSTSLIHHLTKEHKNHDSYQQLWDAANEARQENLLKMVSYEHAKKEPKARLWRCHGCGFKATCNADMRSHKSGCEKLKRGYVCHICGKKLMNHSARWYHMKTRHGLALGNKKPQFYPCPICGKVCDVPSRLEKHLLSHSEKRNYICDWCAQPFKTSFGLGRHIQRIHKNIYPYYCDKCGHGLKNKMWLEKHKCERRRKNRVSRVPKAKGAESAAAVPTSMGRQSKQPDLPPRHSLQLPVQQIVNAANEIAGPAALASQILTAQLVNHAHIDPPGQMAINIVPIAQEEPLRLNMDQMQLRTNPTDQLQLRTDATGQLQLRTPVMQLPPGVVQPAPVAVDVSAYFPPSYDYLELLRHTTGNL